MGDTWSFNYAKITVCFTVYFLLLHVTEVNCGSLEMVSKDTFQKHLKEHKYLLTLFFYDVETCPKCVKAIEELEKVDTPDLYETEIKKVKCEDPGTAVHYGITTVPQVIYFRDGVPALYDIPEETREIIADQVQEWLDVAKETAMQTLTDDSFEHLTQASTGATTGDWLIIFYKDSCQGNLPAIEGAGVKIKHRMNVAKVNVDENPELALRFKIKECPTTYYFRLGKMYLYYSEEPDQYHVRSLISFVNSWYKNVKAQVVPKQPTAFDKLTEAIADYLKEQMNSPNRGKILIGCSIVMGVVAFLVALSLVMCNRKKDIKTE